MSTEQEARIEKLSDYYVNTHLETRDVWDPDRKTVSLGIAPVSVDDVRSAFIHGAEWGIRDGLAQAINFIGECAQGECEKVNMGDATIAEIQNQLMMYDYMRKKLRALMEGGGK